MAEYPATSEPDAAALSQSQTPYVDAIRRYADTDYVRLDVPGHSGSALAQPELAELFGDRVLKLDLPPLVDGVDQGTAPTALQQSARLAAEAWGARRTWLVTNGASKANLVACLALRHLGEHVVVQRSMHSSVMDGMVLGGLIGHYVQPDVDADIGAAHGVRPAALADALDAQPEAVAAYVVTPSYFGAVSDVPGLAQVAHARGVLLIVDQAWAAHFGFHPDVPENALRQGADLVISSTHKLGGSLTQSAMLHLGNGPRADELEPLVNRAFRSMQSTSASSLLMMSLDVARHSLAVHGRERIQRSLDAAARLRAGLADDGRFADLSDRFLQSPAVVGIDPLRIAIDTRVGGLSGHTARQLLFHDHRVHTEMATDSAVVAVIGAGAAPDIPRVLDALRELPDEHAENAPLVGLPDAGPIAMTLRQAYFAPAELIPTDQAVGRISADSLAAYPPGIPNVLPGEVFTADVLTFLCSTAMSPFGHVRGAADTALTHVRVLKQTSFS